MTLNNHILKSKYGVSQTVTSLIGRMMTEKEIYYQLKYQDVSVKSSEYQNKKVQEKKLRVFNIEDAFKAVMLRLNKAKIATSNKQRKSIPILEKAFSELSKAIREIYAKEIK